ncbi:hypothetical protein BDN71DRAFT_1452151 [Pleurotus eryngii]|uniref:Uncharacterized protein n=1 Tax=Pleurotus eryngii TaxID=5323 RepID=A0A9P5ZTA6_PLEER|nr:hypothetical protein BDN71DRAFT_1452151 [Pleurotus eryngii]
MKSTAVRVMDIRITRWRSHENAGGLSEIGSRSTANRGYRRTPFTPRERPDGERQMNPKMKLSLAERSKCSPFNP